VQNIILLFTDLCWWSQ